MKKPLIFFSLITILWSCSSDKDNPIEVLTPENEETSSTPCDDGMAGIYPCKGYDLLGHITLSEMNATFANDIWGWTDSSTDNEYALIGLSDGTAFVNITDTENLIYLGKLPTATVNSSWRDIKVYEDHAFIVSEADGHGMQVFDLTKLRNASSTPTNFTADARYTGFGNAHNIVINEETGFAYAVGTARDDIYSGGVHFINISNPKTPLTAGGWGGNGYTHDAQVVTYNGPDTRFSGDEILIGANEDEVVIVNVTNKEVPVEITTFTYPQLDYTHQGWLTDDHKYFILGDEIDEITFGFDSRTLVFDFTLLDDPDLHTTYQGPTEATDHNGYVKGDEFFLANYTAGLRVLDISDIENKNIIETGFFDTFPANNSVGTEALWSVYPYFESGKIILNDTESGFFVVKKSE